jgi:hypothetical protein
MDPENEVVETPLEEIDTGVETTKGVESEPEKPATMEDTLRAKFRELTADPEVAKEVDDKSAKKAKEEKPAVVVDEAGRVRGPDGKFAPKEAVAPEAPKSAETPPVEKAATPEAPVAPVDPAIAKAPTSWKGEAQSKWAALPPEIKAEVHRREADFHKGIQQYKQDADTFKLLDAEIRPYEAMIRASGTNAQALIRDFMATAYQLKTGSPEAKVETLLNIGKAWGVDFNLLPAVQERVEAGQPVVPPEYRNLEQQFRQLQESVAQREQREKQEREAVEAAEREAVARETLAWAASKEHYESVKLDMAALLESGRAKDLDDAYNKATWANPEVRAKLIAQQQEEQRKQAAATAAAAKQAASTNVKPRGTPPVKPTTKMGTMEETIRAAYKKMQAGA